VRSRAKPWWKDCTVLGHVWSEEGKYGNCLFCSAYQSMFQIDEASAGLQEFFEAVQCLLEVP
jgi:hypothetical protein